jgi:hypothetical protein
MLAIETLRNPNLLQEIDLVKRCQQAEPKAQELLYGESGPYKIGVTVTHETEDEVLGLGKYTFDAIGEKTEITIVKKDILETHVTVKQKEIVELKPPGWELFIQTRMYKATLCG